MNLNNPLRDFTPNSISSRSIFDIDGIQKQLADVEKKMAAANFWDDPENAKTVLKERSALSTKVDRWKNLFKDVEECEVLMDLGVEESDAASVEEASHQADAIEKRLSSFSLELMLNGVNDKNNAIVSISAGAGGTEAQDWTEILFRMYSRWVERKGFKMELIDLQEGEEAGIKGVTFSVSGDYAFGYLKAEAGVHRLVRISPFNANGKRHTSFSSVFVYPELNEEIVIEIDEKDLRIDTFRASGSGGQHVNKTSSAVRITHLPTGIVVQSQQERSQIRNRDLCMKVLRARMYQQERDKQEEKLQAMHDTKGDIAWGNQIRSYVLHPYQMIKDHRINFEVGNVDKVLDGDLDPFIQGVLLSGKNLN